MPIAAASAMTLSPTMAGSDRNGQSTAPIRPPSAIFSEAISGNVAEPFQPFFDLFFRISFVELLDFLFERVRDELLHRGVPGDVRVTLDPIQERFIQLDFVRPEHSSDSPL